MSRLSQLGVVALLGLFALSTIAFAFAVTGAPVSAQKSMSNASPSVSGVGGCPASNALGSYLEASTVGASVSKGASTWTFYFSSLVNLSPSNGVPGLIQYCVYPSGGLPSSMTVSAVGADGSSFTTVTGSHQGYFAYARSGGNPTNLPLDGSMDVTMGTATWSSGTPTNATVLLHINDANTCSAIYGGWPSTCFVYPSGWLHPLCDGAAACKTATVAEATSTSPLTLPANTILHIEYTITVVNQPSNSFDMEFVPLSMTPGAWTGLKDSFTCWLVVDSSGSPGANGTFPNYQGSGIDLKMSVGNPAPGCLLPRLTANVSTTAVVLHPGDSFSITIDMVSTGGLTAGAGPEHGLYCLNKGVDVQWYQSDDLMVHHFHTVDIDAIVS